MGLAALKIPELCAHPFPINDPAENVAHNACFLPRRQIAGSRKMGATVLWRGSSGGLAGERVAPGGHWNAAYD